jgi:two-component system chemotaxis response regulator CheB
MTKVFVIDDSVTVRKAFRDLFDSMDDIDQIGEADNPVDAFDIFKKVGLPDLFILDIEMPRMDGLTFLQQINEQRPTPVIICSSLVNENSSASIDALRLGAAEIIEKPKHNLNQFFNIYRDELKEKIRTIAYANIDYKNRVISSKLNSQKIQHEPIASSKVVAIGSSTGGIQVLEEIIDNLKHEHTAILIVQHIPKGFSASLANRLNSLSRHTIIKEAVDGEMIKNNTIYIAPGGLHMEIKKSGIKYYISLKEFPKVNSHRPSVNVLFNSVAKEFKANAIGFVLTGMGDDGATGLKKMRDNGAKTYVQNAQTCVVYGMPKVAKELDAAEAELSVFEIIQTINAY